MKFTEEIYQKIHEYLAGELSETQRNQFESLLEKDPELAEEVSIHRQMQDNLGRDSSSADIDFSDGNYQTYRQFLDSEEAQAYRETISKVVEKHIPRRNRTWYYLAAAVLVVLVMSLAVYYSWNSQGSPLESYYTWNELPSLTERTSGGDPARAQRLFEAKNYKEALVILEPLIGQEEEIGAEVYLYTGICQYELGDVQRAVATMEKLLQSDLLDRNKARWYLALFYLSMEKTSLARVQLEYILTDELNFFDTEAKKILRSIN